MKLMTNACASAAAIPSSVGRTSMIALALSPAPALILKAPREVLFTVSKAGAASFVAFGAQQTSAHKGETLQKPMVYLAVYVELKLPATKQLGLRSST